MEEVIGLRGTPGHGSLMEWGVTYRWVLWQQQRRVPDILLLEAACWCSFTGQHTSLNGTSAACPLKISRFILQCEQV